ncbi:ABC transporter permease [Actinocatenispora rupis]|uniref:ABC transporter permease n=1 Tax=Actinocatenispora rupis TaxID=519421 RepID=A0A8J3NEA5_9ACTN|nr:ABC transporter permease subunit [Actinocatenispora rupis]GID13730.1 ABC transporter permease [Actinocatenispora rupis]
MTATPAVESTVDGSATGYRAAATLRVGTEIRRQLTRRRTQLVLGFLVLLPVILFLAFRFGSDGNDTSTQDQSGGFVTMAKSGAANFTVFTLFVSASFLLVVVVALFCGDTVASEASWGSLRYLLAVPVPRSRLLGVKLLVGLLYSAVALVLLTGVAMLVGTAAFGWHPLRTMTGDSIPADAAVLRIAGVVGYLAVTLLVAAGLAFLLSVCTDAALGAVGGAVLLFIVSSILDQVTALGSLRALLPTHYQTAYTDLLTEPVQWDQMARGALSALLYAAVFLSLAWYRFLRKDVTS